MSETTPTGNPHRSQFAVRYHETDQMGVVHHAVYVHYFEVGRTEMMQAHGLDYAEMERRGSLLAVVDVGLRYVAPARFGDVLVVETTLTSVERVRVQFQYRVLRSGEDEQLLARGHSLLACVDRDLNPARIPGPDRAKMLALLGPR